MYKCTCSNCGITKCNFVKEAQRGEGLGDVLLHAGLKSIWELDKAGVTWKKELQQITLKMCQDQGLDNLASKIPTRGSGLIDKNSILLPKSKRKTGSDHVREIYERPAEGKGFDIQKMIGKLPKPKRGFNLPSNRYAGTYNPLEKQLKYDQNTGEILEIYHTAK